MSTEWYYAVEGKSRGPFNEDEFRQLTTDGTIHSDTLVWQEGMADWLPYGRSAAADAGAPMPPPPLMNGGDGTDPARADANTFVGALKDGFARYVDFRTRSTRPQFWWWTLWTFLLGFAASIVDAMIGLGDVGAVNGIISLALLLPSVAVAVRRLHDIGRTGWWYLLVLIPLIGWIVLIVFFCTRGEEGPNKWGNAPRN